MKKRIILTTLYAILLITSCRTDHYAENREYLKEYAFCQCVEFASGDSIPSKDISRSVYRDIAHYDLTVYDAIDSLSKLKAMQIPASVIFDYGGKKAVFLHCFQYYHSSQLDSMVRKQDGKISGE